MFAKIIVLFLLFEMATGDLEKCYYGGKKECEDACNVIKQTSENKDEICVKMDSGVCRNAYICHSVKDAWEKMTIIIVVVVVVVVLSVIGCVACCMCCIFCKPKPAPASNFVYSPGSGPPPPPPPGYGPPPPGLPPPPP